MNLKLLTIAVIGLWAGGLLAEDKPADKPAFKDDSEKASYALGLQYGKWMGRQGFEYQTDALLRGIKDGAPGSKPLLTDEELMQVIREAQKQSTDRLKEKNKKAADDFLAANKAKDGVKTTESGLQYKVLAEGNGAVPGSNDMVTVHYRGRLLDGTEFDSSYKRNQPFTTAANRGIKGWTEALQLMKPGSKWELFIPPNLAYGDNGGGPIPPASLLTFEVEMLSNSPPPPPAPAPATAATPLTSDIIKVPSLEEMKKGAKIETIKAEDIDKEIKKQQESQKQPQPPK